MEPKSIVARDLDVYRRGAALEKLCPLMEAWAAYCDRPGDSNNVAQLAAGGGVMLKQQLFEDLSHNLIPIARA